MIQYILYKETHNRLWTDLTDLYEETALSL